MSKLNISLLTKGEREVIELILFPYNQEAIGEVLGIRRKAVGQRLHSIYKKLGLKGGRKELEELVKKKEKKDFDDYWRRQK
jgi:DNA-binding CsgD family transcriptional regulator